MISLRMTLPCTLLTGTRTYFASGGGFSDYFEAPTYQKSTVDAYVASLDGLHEGFYNPGGRAYPDVSGA